jgi:hypothetical protein
MILQGDYRTQEVNGRKTTLLESDGQGDGKEALSRLAGLSWGATFT